MATISAKYFSTVEYIKKLRKAEIIEQQAHLIQDQNTKINTLESKELATKSDLLKTEIRIMFLLGAGFLSMFGVLGKGFHWF